MTYSVPFADYEADMRENAEQAAGIVRKLRKDITDRDRLIRMLIAASGGKIEVPLEVMSDPPDQLVVMFDPANFRMIYSVKRKSENFIS